MRLYLLLALLCLCLTGVADARIRRMKRQQQQQVINTDTDTDVELDVKQQNQVKWNTDLTVRILKDIKSAVTQDEYDRLHKLLFVRQTRMDAAVGIAVQQKVDISTQMAKVLKNVVCIAKAAFPTIGDEILYGALFALPGSKYEAFYAAATYDAKTPKGISFRSFDNDRWGPFLGAVTNSVQDLSGWADVIAEVKKQRDAEEKKQVVHPGASAKDTEVTGYWQKNLWYTKLNELMAKDGILSTEPKQPTKEDQTVLDGLKKDLTANVLAVTNIIEQKDETGKTPLNNYRPYMHLFARLSVYGEKNLKNFADIPRICPYSFRHALLELYRTLNGVKNSYESKIDAAKKCGLNVEKLQRQFGQPLQGKSAFEFERTSPANQVENPEFFLQPSGRLVDGKAEKYPSNIAEVRPPLTKGSGRYGRAQMNSKNTWTSNLRDAVHMPALLNGEKEFIKNYPLAKEGQADKEKDYWGKAQSNVDLWLASKPLPGPGAGGNVFDMSFSHENAVWMSAMFDNGLITSGGPSGTTDEALQIGDYTKDTSDLKGCCLLRNAPFANMVLNTHHTYAEVAQGAGDGWRGCPMFKFQDPWSALQACNSADGVWDDALKIYDEMTKNTDQGKKYVAALKQSDYGLVHVPGGTQVPRRGIVDGLPPNFPGHYDISLADELRYDPDHTLLITKLCRISKLGQYTKEVLCRPYDTILSPVTH